MRSLIAATIFSFFFSIQSFAGDNTFVPSTPYLTITSGDEEGMVSLAPTFSASEVSGIDISAPNAVYTLQASEWLVYESTDPAVKLLGGFETHTNNLVYSTTTFEELDFPYSVNIDGIAVDRIRIYGAPKIELLGSMGEILAEVSMIPDFTDNVTHQPNRQALVLSKEFNDVVVYNWYMQNSSTSQNNWMSTFQIVVRYDGQVGARSSINDLDDAFFSIQSSFKAVGCKLRNNGNLRSLNGNLADWKATLTNQMVSQFSFLCSQGSDEILLSTFTDADPTYIPMPSFIIQSTSASTDYVVSDEKALSPNTNYTAQVRYSVFSDSKPGINNTFWSAPISFKTVEVLNNDSEYHIGLTENSGKPFIAGQQGAITLDVYNVGQVTGNPSVFLRLPFDIFSVDGAAAALVSLAPKHSCNAEVSNGYTILTCEIFDLLPGETSSVEAFMTFSIDQGQFEYAVCETDNCETPDYVQTRVNILSSDAPNESSDSSGSSSSGGAIILLLFAASFLRRRKKV